jgi:MFS family permease
VDSVFLREGIAVLGILIYSCGDALFGAAWFPILRPIVPEETRGRFFGKLRISWQLAGLLFSGAVAWIIGKEGNTRVYQLIMAVITALLICRTYFYSKLPELEKSKEQKESFISLFSKTFRIENYASFSAYIFLLMIFSYNTPNLFAMVEKEILKLNSETVIWLANAGLIGALAGYYLGGRAVDRFSSKPVFLFCHFSYATFSFLFLLRGIHPHLTIPVMGFCHLGFGFVYAASSIAITSEIFGLMPKENQALANSILTTMLFFGTSVSGLICAWILDFDFLKRTWRLMNMQMSDYDAIILLNGGMIILLAAALGLVPSIMRKAMPLPS